jgi:undecaprenyl-diphosphatase
MAMWTMETKKRYRLPVALAVMSVLSFVAVTACVVTGLTADFDRRVMFLFRNGSDHSATIIGPPWVQEVGRDVTALGSLSIMGLLTIGAVGFLVLTRKWRLAVSSVVIVIGGLLIANALKYAIARPRQDFFALGAKVFTTSFPSSHAALSAITYPLLASLLSGPLVNRQSRSYIWAAAVLIVVLVGGSRLYLGVHYPTDVLGGWLLGAAWFSGCWALLLRPSDTRVESRSAP